MIILKKNGIYGISLGKDQQGVTCQLIPSREFLMSVILWVPWQIFGRSSLMHTYSHNTHSTFTPLIFITLHLYYITI